MTEAKATANAIVEASNHPLSIVAVGVGDGPWAAIEEFDHRLPTRRFDNFRFVDYHKATSKSKAPDVFFALQVLMEIPDQYKRIVELGYLGEAKKSPRTLLVGSSPPSFDGDRASDDRAGGGGGDDTASTSGSSSSRRGTPSNSPGRASLGRASHGSPKINPVMKSPRRTELKHRISNVSF